MAKKSSDLDELQESYTVISSILFALFCKLTLEKIFKGKIRILTFK